ncbi:MAG TPA: hypothetical protein PKD26_11395 [Pyrinomonadaceae bacterium]|nr:hypothetical protein [Pyrinomonadaceae bacterium]
MLIKTKCLIFSFLLVAGSIYSSFGQNYLTAEQDVGFDIARTIVADAPVRTEPKYTASVVTTFKIGYNLTLLNRKDVGGWYEISDINSLKRGWINGSQISLYLSRGNFRNPQAESKCSEPLILKPDEDNGYDIVKMDIPGGMIWFTPIEPEGNPGYVRAVGQDDKFILLSREAFDPKGIAKRVFKEFKVFWINEGKIGYISCMTGVSRYYSTKPSGESPFVKQRSSNSYAAPVTNIHNDADRDLTLFIDDVKYTIPSKSTKILTLSAGRHTFIATAPGVIPLSGSDVWEQGYVYTWTFYIGRRYR